MGYSAGNLELSILGFSDKAVASVDVTTKALRRLASAVKLIGKTNFTQAGLQLNYIFKEIAKSTNQINTQNIEHLASAAKSLASISRLSNLEKMDFEKVGKGFNTLSIAITPFLDKVKEAEASLTALDGVLRRSSGKKIQGLLDGGGKGNDKRKGGLFGLLRGGASLYMIRRLGHFMANLVQAGSDYNETLNLWQVAMRNNLDVADQFVNKMQKAYGISSKTLMNAQAIFKNMVGNLGNVSDATAYALSEALVQMSVDFSSLYNVKLNEAFNKMQAMLARQVRPIRSVSGYDITENTIYELYQAIGGTKTMRQLNNTEKQLLSIYAVFKQMGASGALGDMSKTINEFANQSRMMTEYWQELKTWSGLLLKDLIDDWGLLVKINALLITATEVVKAIAKARGVGDENYLTGLFETTEATNDAVDELQGKLLDFDKFRSLEGASASPLAIDEKLLQAITGYSSKIDQAENKAQQLAATWTKFWVDQDGHLTEDGERVLSIIEGIVKVLGILLSIKVAAWLGHLVKGLFAVKIAGQSVSTLGIAVIIYSLIELVGAIKDGDDAWAIAMGSLATVATLFVLLNSKIGPAIKSLKNFSEAMIFIGVAILSIGINEFISNFDKLSTKAKVWIPILAGLAGAITAVAAGLTFMKGNWVGAIGLGAAVAGVGLMVGTKLSIPNYEMGASDIDSGTVFRAGEFGKTEAVYTGSNGKTNVANVRQMEQAFYNALSRHSREGNGTIVVQTYLDGEKVYENTTAKAKSRGNVWAKV